jgi:hypothetical protein
VLRDLEGVNQLLPDTAKKIPELDFHCSLMSLPLALGTTLETIPNQVPYIRSEPQKVEQWRDRLGPKSQLRVGLVWSGGHQPHQTELKSVNARRNIPLQKLAPLRMDGVSFYSLQKGQPAEAELPALTQAGWSGPPIIDLTAELHDFSDTAALIEHLDLVISVDTSTARALRDFADVLTNWYVRRSRDRFWSGSATQDGRDAFGTNHPGLKCWLWLFGNMGIHFCLERSPLRICCLEPCH